MTAYLMQGNGIKSIPLSAVKPETLANWWGWPGGETDRASVATLYGNVPWLYRGVNAICNSLVNMPHVLHKDNVDGDEVSTDVLNFETPMDDLLDIFTGYLLFYGAAYGKVENNKYGISRDFRPYSPTTITPQYDTDQGFTGVKRTVNGNEYIITPENGLFYSWLPNRTAETGPGLAPVAAALAAAGVLHNIDLYAEMYFKNGAVNPTLISVEGAIGDKSDRERLEAWYKRMLSGVRKAFGITVVNGKVSAQTIGYALKDLATTELSASKREDVSTALGVPQTLLFSNAANYATAQQDDLHFYDKTIRPLAIRLQNALNKQVYQPMGYFLQFHPERMPIYQELKAKEASGVVELYKARIVTLNETRERLELPPIEGGDEMAALPVAPMPAGQQPGSLDPNPPKDETVVNEEPSKPDTQPVAEKKAHDHAHEDTPARDDLFKWQLVATKRLKENKLSKATDFESKAIRPTLMASIKGALETAKTSTDIKHIFTDAMEWVAYP
jgi:HK97 family phage portal protein